MDEINQEIESINKKTKVANWESDLKLIDHIIVAVPLKLLLVCNHIASEVDDNEFSIVTGIEEKTLDRIVLKDEYYIPKQIVSEGFIEYLTDDYSHNVVIHRHPDGLNSFSSTDYSFINQNFELSLLYTKKDSFVNGIYNMRIEDTILQLPVKVIIQDGHDEIDLSNIQLKRYHVELTDTRNERGLFPKESPSFLDEIMAEVSDLQHKVAMMEAYFYR